LKLEQLGKKSKEKSEKQIKTTENERSGIGKNVTKENSFRQSVK
jgi:hypothetical protein